MAKRPTNDLEPPQHSAQIGRWFSQINDLTPGVQTDRNKTLLQEQDEGPEILQQEQDGGPKTL